MKTCEVVVGEFLTYKQTAAYVNISERTVRRQVRRGDFPRPVRVSMRCVRFRKSELDAWLLRRATFDLKR